MGATRISSVIKDGSAIVSIDVVFKSSNKTYTYERTNVPQAKLRAMLELDDAGNGLTRYMARNGIMQLNTGNISLFKIK